MPTGNGSESGLDGRLGKRFWLAPKAFFPHGAESGGRTPSAASSSGAVSSGKALLGCPAVDNSGSWDMTPPLTNCYAIRGYYVLLGYGGFATGGAGFSQVREKVSLGWRGGCQMSSTPGGWGTKRCCVPKPSSCTTDTHISKLTGHNGLGNYQERLGRSSIISITLTNPLRCHRAM